MDMEYILNEYVEYLRLVGKARNIEIQNYNKDKGILILKNHLDLKVYIKRNKSCSSLDLSIYIRPYKKDSVEILHPYKKKIKVGVNELMNIVEETFDYLNSMTEDNIVL